MKSIHVQMPDELLGRLRERSAVTDVPVTRLVRRAVEEFLSVPHSPAGARGMLAKHPPTDGPREMVVPEGSMAVLNRTEAERREKCSHPKTRFTGYGKVCRDCGELI